MSDTVGKVLVDRLLRQSYRGIVMSEQPSFASDATIEILYTIGLQLQDRSWSHRCALYQQQIL